MFERTVMWRRPPTPVWIRQVGPGPDRAVPGLLHAWRVTRRKGVRVWEAQVSMCDGRRPWRGWVNARDVLPRDA